MEKMGHIRTSETVHLPEEFRNILKMEITIEKTSD